MQRDSPAHAPLAARAHKRPYHAGVAHLPRDVRTLTHIAQRARKARDLVAVPANVLKVLVSAENSTAALEARRSLQLPALAREAKLRRALPVRVPAVPNGQREALALAQLARFALHESSRLRVPSQCTPITEVADLPASRWLDLPLFIGHTRPVCRQRPHRRHCIPVDRSCELYAMRAQRSNANSANRERY
eukprot:3634928-Rhodomonas_salina.1